MSAHLRIVLVLFSILLISIILFLVREKKVPIKYSLFWIFSALLIFLVGCFPNFINFFTSLVGFQTTSNLVIGIILGIVLFITLLLTIIISEQKNRIKLLIQEISLLKEKINKNDR